MKRILIVDDDQANARVLALLLERYGYEAVFELDGAAALKTAAAFKPDVVFIDLAMPAMNGYELAKQLRQQASDSSPKLVSLTGVPRGFGHGDDSVFEEYLLKPANVVAIRRVIDAEPKEQLPASSSCGR
jgi:CheY-like chemotaxis protein